MISYQLKATDTLSLDYRAEKVAQKLLKQIQTNKENDKKGLSYLNNYIIVDEIKPVIHNSSSLWDFSQTTGDLNTLKTELTAYNSTAGNQKVYLVVASIYNRYYDIAYFNPQTGKYDPNKENPLKAPNNWLAIDANNNAGSEVSSDTQKEYEAAKKAITPELESAFSDKVYKKAFNNAAMPDDGITALMITNTYEWIFSGSSKKPRYRIADGFSGRTKARNDDPDNISAYAYYLRMGYYEWLGKQSVKPTRHQKALQIVRSYIGYFNAIKGLESPIAKHWMAMMMGWHQRDLGTLPDASTIEKLRGVALDAWDKLYKIRMYPDNTYEKEQLVWEMYRWSMKEYVAGIGEVLIPANPAAYPKKKLATASELGQLIPSSVSQATSPLSRFIYGFCQLKLLIESGKGMQMSNTGRVVEGAHPSCNRIDFTDYGHLVTDPNFIGEGHMMGLTQEEKKRFVNDVHKNPGFYGNWIAYCIWHAEVDMLDYLEKEKRFYTIYTELQKQQTALGKYFFGDKKTNILQGLLNLFHKKNNFTGGEKYVYATKAWYIFKGGLGIPDKAIADEVKHTPVLQNSGNILLQSTCYVIGTNTTIDCKRGIPDYQTKEVSIFAPLEVYFHKEHDPDYFGGRKSVLMPAIYFYWMRSEAIGKDNVQAAFHFIANSAELASWLIGVGEIAAGLRLRSGLKVLRGLAQVTPELSRTALSISKDKILEYFGAEKDAPGRDFVEKWEKVNQGLTIIGVVGSGVLELPELIKMVKSYKKLKALNNPQLINCFDNIDSYNSFEREINSFLGGDITKLQNDAFEDIATKLTVSDLDIIRDVVLKVNDNFLDVIVHADNNNKYFVYLENAKGELEKKDLTTADIVQIIENAEYAKNKIVRLLSCSDLESAKQISALMPDRTMVATNDIVRLHIDGGITTIAKSGNATQKWYTLEKGNIKSEFTFPLGSDFPDIFIELGTPPKELLEEKFIASLIRRGLSEDEATTIFLLLDEAQSKLTEKNLVERLLKITPNSFYKNPQNLLPTIKGFLDENGNVLSLDKFEIFSKEVNSAKSKLDKGNRDVWLPNSSKPTKVFTNIDNQLQAIKSHALGIDFKPRPKELPTGEIVKVFTGGHFERAFADYVISHSNATYTIEGKNPTTPQDNEVYEGYPVLINNGTTCVKDADRLTEFADNQFGGKSTFFPMNWDEAKILTEVKYAIENHAGTVTTPLPGDNVATYKGYTANGTEIHFKVEIATDNIQTFYPVKR